MHLLYSPECMASYLNLLVSQILQISERIYDWNKLWVDVHSSLFCTKGNPSNWVILPPS